MALWECRVDLEPNEDGIALIDGRLEEIGDEHWSTFQDVIAQRAWLLGVFPNEDAARKGWVGLRRQLPRHGWREPSFRELPDVDWRESYKAHFKAWHCGPVHWIPEWERSTRRIPGGHAAVYLDPGLAFGTGNHETTRLCCRRLVEFARTRAPRTRAATRVIDAGCGSGILAITAARLGFTHVYAFDNDAEAVAIARQNVRRNGTSRVVRLGVGGLETQLRRRRAHLVLANIQADVLVAHASVLLQSVEPGGWLVLSGILAGELGSVRNAFRSLAGAGWRISSRRLGEWADLRLIAPTRRA